MNRLKIADMPVQVQEVIQAALANARKLAVASLAQCYADDSIDEGDEEFYEPNAFANRRVYFGQSKDCCGKVVEPAEYFVMDNYESGIPSLIFRENEWYIRSVHTGREEKLVHGHAEAISNASLMFIDA